MAKTKSRSRAKRVEAKELKLVCKCGSCTHWEIILVRGAKGEIGREYIKCIKCGVDFDCYFSIGAHESLHYERHTKKDASDKELSCATAAGKR